VFSDSFIFINPLFKGAGLLSMSLFAVASVFQSDTRRFLISVSYVSTGTALFFLQPLSMALGAA